MILLGTDDTSYGQVKTVLESKNYIVSTLNLIANPKIPSDAEEIIIAGPQKPLSSGEVELLSNSLMEENPSLSLKIPLPLTKFGTYPDPLAEYLQNDWGIRPLK